MNCHNAARKIKAIQAEMEELREQEGNQDWNRWYELRSHLHEAYKEKKSYWC